MKNKIITSALLTAFISFSGNMFAQELFRADFETYETTPSASATQENGETINPNHVGCIHTK